MVDELGLLCGTPMDQPEPTAGCHCMGMGRGHQRFPYKKVLGRLSTLMFLLLLV